MLASCFTLALSFSIYNVFLYGITVKYVSVVALSIQINILHDSLLIFLDKKFIPSLNQSGFGRCLKITFCYILPSVLFLGLYGYCFLMYSSVCTTYFMIILINFVFSVFLLGINLMRIYESSIISTLWFITLVGLMTHSTIASTPHTTCVDSAGVSLVTWTAIVWDCVLATVILTFCLMFICFVTREDLDADEYIVEAWLYWFFLSEEPARYIKKEDMRKIKYSGKLSRLNPKQRQMIDFTTLRRLKNNEEAAGASTYLGIELSDLKAPFQIDNGPEGEETDIDGGHVRKTYRSLQAFFFHMSMSLFSCYIGAMLIGWIHINLDADLTNSGVGFIDDASVWARFAAMLFGLISVTFKAIMSHRRRRKYRDYE